MSAPSEFDEKQARLRDLLAKQQLDAILLRRAGSLAWVTCGVAPDLNVATSYASSAALITRDTCFLITTNLEADRLASEMGPDAKRWTWRVREWHAPDAAVASLAQGLRLGADHVALGALDLSAEVARLRARLTAQEIVRYRSVAAACAAAVCETARAIRPGQSEHAMSARLAYAAGRRGLQVTLHVVAADDNLSAFRHPLPTGSRLARYAMLVLNARRGGLVASNTRFVHFGPLPDSLRAAERAAAQVAGAFIAATQPGRALNEIVDCGLAAYRAVGAPDEWRRHHLGGLGGYEAREVFATPWTRDLLCEGHVCAWNPSYGATRSVDTFLVRDHGCENLTTNGDWPQLVVERDGGTILRPAILERS